MSRVSQILKAGMAVAKTRQGKSRIEEMGIYDEYAEPGYSYDGPIALGNWNDITKWNEETSKSETVDDTPSRVAKLLEQAGVALEWSDEWICCDECGKIFRTSPDCYAWQMSGVWDEMGSICADCLADDPSDHLERLEGKNTRCNTISSIDPSKHGYARLNLDFENGFHPGQTDDPRKIGQALKNAGIERYLFDLTGTGQFDVSFAVYVHESHDVGQIDDAVQAIKEL